MILMRRCCFLLTTALFISLFLLLFSQDYLYSLKRVRLPSRSSWNASLSSSPSSNPSSSSSASPSSSSSASPSSSSSTSPPSSYSAYPSSSSSASPSSSSSTSPSSSSSASPSSSSSASSSSSSSASPSSSSSASPSSSSSASPSSSSSASPSSSSSASPSSSSSASPSSSSSDSPSSSSSASPSSSSSASPSSSSSASPSSSSSASPSSSSSASPSSSSSASPSSNSSATTAHLDIVRIIHQTWKTRELPPRFGKWSSTWPACFPSWQHRVWSDADNLGLVSQNYPWFLDTYQRFPENIYRADAIRYMFMHRFGGVYTDLDTACVRPFEHLLQNHQLVFGAMSGQGMGSVQEGYVENSFFYSKVGHPFWLGLLQDINAIVNGTAGGPRWDVDTITGPFRLMETINKYRKSRHDSGQPDDVKVYPSEYFNPFSWIGNSDPDVQKTCKGGNNMSEKETELCLATFRSLKWNNTYAVNFHTYTWRGGKVLRR